MNDVSCKTLIGRCVFCDVPLFVVSYEVGWSYVPYQCLDVEGACPQCRLTRRVHVPRVTEEMMRSLEQGLLPTAGPEKEVKLEDRRVIFADQGVAET